MDGTTLTLMLLAAALMACLGWLAGRRRSVGARDEAGGPPPWFTWALAVAAFVLNVVASARLPEDALGTRLAALAAFLLCGALGWVLGRGRRGRRARAVDSPHHG